MPQTLLAIDISPRALRVVTVETTLRKTELVKMETLPIEGEATRADVLRALRQSIAGPIDSVVVSADGRAATTRTLRFPFGDVRKVEAAIAFELEGLLPYEIEDAALTWEVTTRAPTSTEVLTAVTPRKALVERLEEMRAADLEPRGVVLAAASLAELVPESDVPVAVVSVGDTETHVAIARQGVRMTRTLRVGGVDLDRAIAKAYGIDVAQAREAKEREATLTSADDPEHQRLAAALMQGLTPLVTGLATTFKALPHGDMPQKLSLTGGGSRLRGLADYLAQKLGLPVELLDLKSAADTVGGSVSAVGPEYAMALGMALGMVRRGRALRLNFRRGEFAYQGDIAMYRGQFTRVAVGVSAVILLAIFGSTLRYSTISAEEARINKGFCEATKKIVGREICDATAALATMRSTPGAGEGVVIPPYSAGTLFEMLSKSVASDIDVTFSELDFSIDGRAGVPDSINGKGDAASFDATEQIVAGLKRDPCVQSAEISNSRRSRDGARWEFNLQVKVACPGGVLPGNPGEVARGGPALGEPQVGMDDDDMGDAP